MTDIKNKFKGLDAQVNSFDPRGRNPMLICTRLNSMYETGLEAEKMKNFDVAYYYFGRWLLCVNWLKKQKLDQKTIKEYFPNDKIKEIKGRFEEIKTSITITCQTAQQLSKQLSITENSKVDSKVNSDGDIDIKFPETPSDEPQPKKKDEITCTELYKILNQNNKTEEKRVLIIDVRKTEEFEQLRISFQNNLIHIPPEKIQLSHQPNAYYLDVLKKDKEAINRFNRRSSKYTDIVVLIDSDSLNTAKINSPISLLKRCLEERDAGTKYNRLAILKGGFNEWVNTYPDLVLDLKSSRLHSTSFSSTEFDGTNYDFCSLNENQNFVPSPILGGSHRVGVKAKLGSASNSQKTEISSTHMRDTDPYISIKAGTSIHDKTKSLYPSIPSTIFSSSNGLHDKLMQTNSIKDVKVHVENMSVKKPVVDRSNKPSLDKNVFDQSGKSIYEQNSISDWQHEQRDTVRKMQQLNAERNGTSIYPSLENVQTPFKLRPARPLKPDIIMLDGKENIPIIPPKIEQPQTPVKKMDIDEEEICKVPLKSENTPKTPTLKRSLSVPNFQDKVKKQKTNHQALNGFKPEVNRSTKPDRNKAAEITNSKISCNRERRMEPVYASSQLHPGITGLKNLGNSCYMNSIIQCLSNTVYLANYFITNKYVNDLNKNHDKGFTHVAEEVAQVIKALWRGQYKTISPRDLKTVVGQYKLQFESYDQQDSHEFLMFLLDWMHNDLKQRSKTLYDRELSTAEKEWEKSMDGQSSIVSKLFFGQLRSSIACQECGKISTTYETFNSLTMSLPVANRCSLDDCFKKFVSGQKVSGWKCPNCNAPREAVKKFDIAKLPHIIVIHLNRFGDARGCLEKKNTAVEFPLTNFNLKSYVVQDEYINNSVNSSYNLYAMSNHYGTMDGGHYTAFCKISDQNKWYKYDDHTVTEVLQDQVRKQSNSAYLLFYASVSAEPYLNS